MRREFMNILKKSYKKKRDREIIMWEDNILFVNWYFLFFVVINFSKNIVEDKKYSVILKIEIFFIFKICSLESNYIFLEMRFFLFYLILNLFVLKCFLVLEFGVGSYKCYW